VADGGYQLGEEALRQIQRGLKRINALPPDSANGPRRQQSFSGGSTGIGVYNTSGGTIPAFAIMRIVSATTLGTEVVYEVGQQSTEFQRWMLVAGESTIANGAYGTGYFLDLPGRALYDSADGTPAYGQIWGPYPSSWKLRRHMYGFRILGDVNSTDTHVRCTQHYVMNVAAKTDAILTKGSTATCSVWKGDRSADSTANISSVTNPFATVAITKAVRVTWNAETPEAAAAEC
jgi:hypothetical protein